MIDPIKDFAEQKLGHPIADADWSPEARDTWKKLRHGEMYGCGAAAFLHAYKTGRPGHQFTARLEQYLQQLRH